MTDPFDSPSSIPAPDYFKPQPFVGSLLLFKPTGEIKDFTYGGTSEATEVVTTDVVVIDEANPSKSLEYPGSNLGAWGIRKVLLPKINQGLVLARLTQGKKSAGKSAPYVLEDPTDEDKDVARSYLQSKAPQI